MRTVSLVVLLLVALVAADVAPLLHADGANVVPNSYIVVLKEHLEVTDRDAHILALRDTITATGANAKVNHVYKIGSLIGFSAELPEDLLKAELAHPDVKYVEADQVMSINYEQEKNARSPLATVTQTGATWGIARVGQRTLPLNTYYAYNDVAGTGVDVYVIDTGILVTHVDFGGRATAVYNAITNEANNDLNGHGTHCAGTIGGTTYGVAKKVTLFAVKVLNAAGSGTTAGVIAGVDYVTNNQNKARKSVGSMSLGGGASATLDASIVNSIASGVTYAIAAGNDNANACNYSPARVANAITVGATTNTDARSSFSNIGTCVDIFAPGSSITSAWIGSNTATNTISGTSMATPHVAGAVALHLSFNTDANPAATKSWATSAATPNVVTNPGTGSPNLLLFSPTGN
jgi:subtilisin family serine protease